MKPQMIKGNVMIAQSIQCMSFRLSPPVHLADKSPPNLVRGTSLRRRWKYNEIAATGVHVDPGATVTTVGMVLAPTASKLFEDQKEND